MKAKKTYQRQRGVSVMLITIILTLAAVLGFGSLAHAKATAADFEYDLPAGMACDFPLHVESRGGTEPKEFKDKDGNTVRMITAGKGGALLFKNLETGATFSLKANGSVTHTTFNADGSSINAVMGHTVLVFFPTDMPPGPSTTLYEGRAVYTIDTKGVWTLQENDSSGRTTDICAELSK